MMTPAKPAADSFTYGLSSQELAVPGEDSATLDELKAKLRAEHQPINTTEEMLVNEMAEQYWRLRRARRLETELLGSDRVVIAHLTAMQRMMSSAERGFHKALAALRQLQRDRRFVPANSAADSTESLQSRDCQGAVKLTAESSEQSSDSGFVPPPCPTDEDIDPADWARAFEARHRVHAKLAAPVE